MDLNGSVALITGGARGIGKAIAQAYAARGARLALVDVLSDELTDTAGELRAGGATVLPIVADITRVEQVDGLVERVEKELGSIEVLINNAGTFSYVGPLWEADPERWMRDIRVNLCGGFLCNRAVVARMVKRERGYVINMVSSGGVGDPHPYSTSYASSKTALMRLTEGLAKEAAPHGVKVFALAPPAVLTHMAKFLMEDPGGLKWRPEFKRNFGDGGKFRPVEIVAQWAVNLVSGRADALSGRYFLATADFDQVIARTEEILKGDLMTLRIR